WIIFRPNRIMIFRSLFRVLATILVRKKAGTYALSTANAPRQSGAPGGGPKRFRPRPRAARAGRRQNHRRLSGATPLDPRPRGDLARRPHPRDLDTGGRRLWTSPSR